MRIYLYRESAVGVSRQGSVFSALGAVGDEPRWLRLKKCQVTDTVRNLGGTAVFRPK